MYFNYAKFHEPEQGYAVVKRKCMEGLYVN